MDFGVAGQVVVVTGGSSGIGLATARVFHEEGAIVVINGRDKDRLDAAVGAIGSNAHGVVADLTTPEGAQKLHAFASGIGPIAILVNNVGRFDVEEFGSITDARWHEYFEANVMTGIRTARLALPEMLARNAGSIVFIASEAAVRSIPFMVHYSVTKTAQLGLARALAEMTRGTQVRVNAYLPGPTATDSIKAYFQEIADGRGVNLEEVLKGFFENDQPGSLIQRLIDPEMHGRAILQLATNWAMNGTAQRADGGAIHSIL